MSLLKSSNVRIAFSIFFSRIEKRILLSQLGTFRLINLGGEPDLLIILSKSESFEISFILPAFLAIQ
jgi:hypothetical protein